MDAWLLNVNDPADVQRYLTAQGLALKDALPVAVDRAGAGNMNLTLRVSTADGRSFIVKQGRPWVEKYAHIPAPFERTLVEAAFYRAVATHPAVAAGMPDLLHVDEANHVLVLQDIGAGGDWTPIYAGETLPTSVVDGLLAWLEKLGRVGVDGGARNIFRNRAMRALNHEHIFDLPLRPDNGLQLNAITAGLADAARELATDRPYCDAVARMGQRYLADGDALVHGDYFPGSWLRSNGTVRIIDPEFCFIGDPEFDYGVMAAHLLLAGGSAGARRVVSDAIALRGLDLSRAVAYAGCEIMRRLIGVAQLPISLGLDRKESLLALSRRLLLEPHLGFA